MEQYSRKESLKILVIKESIVSEEQLVTEIVKIVDKMEVQIRPDDTSVAHRVRTCGKGQIFINEDLTQLQARLFGYIKSLPSVERCNTNNRKIHVNLKDGKYIVVDVGIALFHMA